MSHSEFSVTTAKRIQAADITEKVENAVFESGVRDGGATVFCPHTTAGIFVNEHEPRILSDYERFFDSLAKGKWEHCHVNGNAHAHLVSAVMGPSPQLLVKKGKPLLGTWQQVMLAELDGPRSRRVLVKVVGE